MALISYRQALHDTLREELLRDENVLLLAEEGFVGVAIGAAMLGLRPVVEIMTINFSLLAMDQIVNHAAKIYGMFGGQASVPLVIRTPGGGGQQLSSTHSQNLEVMYAYVR